MKEPEVYLSQLIEMPSEDQLKKLEMLTQQVDSLAKSIPGTLQMFPGYMDSLSLKKTEIEQTAYTVRAEIMSQVVTDELANEKDEFLRVYEEEYLQPLISKMNDIVDNIQNENKAHNQMLADEVSSANSIFNELKQKHEILLGYNTMVTDLCTRYGVTASDFSIDETTLSPQQLDRVYDEYIKYLRTTKESVNPITILKDKIPNVMAQGIAVLVVIILCFTPILDLLSLVFIVGVIYEMKTMSKKAKYFSLLQALLYNINPDKLSHASIDESLLLPETIDLADSENYPELAGIEEEFDKMEEEHGENVIDAEQANFMIKFSETIGKANAMVKNYSKKFEDEKQVLMNSMNNLIKKAQGEYDRLKDEYVGFGDKFTDNGTFDTKLTLGFNNYIEEYVDIGERNVIIRNNGDEKTLNSFIRCLFVNAITHVNFMKMCVYVLDPNNMGQVIMPFYRSDLDAHIKIVQGNSDEVIDKFTKTAQKNMELMQGQTIAEYNTQCQSLGRDTINYTLLLILSQPKNVEETENLQALFQYSTKAGVLIWMVSDNMEASADTFVFSRPFEGVTHPIRFQDDRDWCSKVSRNYYDAIESYKPPSLAWPKFMTVACPPEQQWTYNADDNMYLYPGFQNGDPDLCKGYPLGNGGNVHALGVGTTGAGKSIFIHHIIQTLCEMYSPRELELWMCDFKGTEFKFYMSSEEFPYTLPHIKACLCTSDGDYATSLFHAVRIITDRRFEQMKNPNEHRDWLVYDDGKNIPNFDNAKNWNIYWRERAKQMDDKRYIDNCYTRVFLISDEFQVIFQTASGKNLDSIKADMTQISKLGRAANVHMFFTSQSMKGTLSGDILNQFSLRFALRCTSDVSMDIMGTPYAAENLPKFGGLYVSATGIKKEDQPKFSTPFISTDQIHESTKILAERAIKENMPKHDVVTYEEATKHPIEELRTFFKKMEENNKLPTGQTLMVMGERMAYSENKAPDNFMVGKKNNENIVACFSDYNDYVLFFNVIYENIQLNKDNGIVIINSQVEELSYLIDAENKLTNKEAHASLLNNSCSEMAKWLDNLIKSRAASGKDSPIWVFLLGWDKGTGFGVDTDLTLRSKINSVLQQAGVYNVHIVMILLSTIGIATGTVATCKYRIAGKCTTDDSMTLLGTKQAALNYEMKTGWMFVNKDGVVTRDKLYISEIEREVAATELVL